MTLPGRLEGSPLEIPLSVRVDQHRQSRRAAKVFCSSFRSTTETVTNANKTGLITLRISLCKKRREEFGQTP